MDTNMNASMALAAMVAAAMDAWQYRHPHPIWVGRSRPARIMDGTPIFPKYKKTATGKTLVVAPEGYVFDGRKDLRSKKRLTTQFNGMKKHKLVPWGTGKPLPKGVLL